MIRPAWCLGLLAMIVGVPLLAVPVPPPKARPVAGDGPVACVLTGPATCKAGEPPDITVRIINRKKSPILLVGSLDGSEGARRYPHCYFEVIDPAGERMQIAEEDCVFMNVLREKDFFEIKAGGSFDPYQHVDDHGFFSPSALNGRTFEQPGKYRLRFVYSSDAGALKAWWGRGGEEGADPVKLRQLLARVPRVQVKSNEIVVEVK